MTKFFQVVKWIVISILTILILGIGYIRFARVADRIIYQTENNYKKFDTYIDFKEYFIPVEEDVEIHAILFQPNSKPIATIFHHLGNDMTLINAQKLYGPLIKEGFQIFAYERRGFAKSSGQADNSITLKNDALQVFDTFLELESVKGTEIIMWGQSLGGAFATMNMAERQNKIEGLIVEGTFTSFPDLGKANAHYFNLQHFKWAIPLLINNDFPAKKEIKRITKPIVIIHSIADKQVPFAFGEKLYKASNKSNTKFWEIEGDHIVGMHEYEKEYVEIFLEMIKE